MSGNLEKQLHDILVGSPWKSQKWLEKSKIARKVSETTTVLEMSAASSTSVLNPAWEMENLQIFWYLM